MKTVNNELLELRGKYFLSNGAKCKKLIFELLNTSLSTRVQNSFISFSWDIENASLNDFIYKSDYELLMMKLFGKKCLKEFREFSVSEKQICHFCKRPLESSQERNNETHVSARGSRFNEQGL